MSAFADRYDFRDPGLFPQEKFCGGFTVNNYRQEVIFLKACEKITET